jgi:hypothetical protein
LFHKHPKIAPSEAVFPKNRWQAFFDVIRGRFISLFQVEMITALFFLPFFLWNIYILFALFGINAAQSDNQSNLLFFRLIQAAGNLLLLPLSGVGVSGGIHVVRLMAYQEMSFLKMDFKKGLQNGWKGDALAFFFLALALEAFILTYSFGQNLGAVGMYLAVGASSVLLLFVFIFVCLEVMQNDLYTLSWLERLQNSFNLFWLDLPVHFAYGLGILAVNGCFYFFQIWLLAIGGMAFFLVIGLALSLLIVVLWVSWSLDKHINKENFPNLYDKGIQRVKKEG